MKEKLKLHWIRQYLRDAGGEEGMDKADWDRLGRGIEWRHRLVDDIVHTNKDPEHVLAIISMLSIRRQIEDELAIYHDEIDALVNLAIEGEIDQEEFEDRLEAITIAVMIFAFLLGGVEDVDQLEEAQRLLYDAALTVLMSRPGNPFEQSAAQMAQYNAGTAVLTNPFFLNDGLTAEQQSLLQSDLDQARKSAQSFGEDITAGKYEGIDGKASAADRTALWVGTAVFIYNLAQTYRADNPFLIWLYSPLKDHCSDCVRLHGQIHTAEEWRASGWVPRGSMLECMGFRCGCNFFVVEGPSVGNF
jgi:hypothetical protein